MMPTYVYKCTKCSREFEKLTSIAGKDDVSCVHCGSPVKRMLSSFNIGGGKKPPITGGSGCFGGDGGPACPHQGSGG